MSRLLALCVLMIAAGLIVTADVQGKGGKGKNKKGALAKKRAEDATLVAELNTVHAAMKKADPIYNGHRAKAMHHVNRAIHELSQEMHKKGLKAKTKHAADEGKTASDLDMASSAKALGTILTQVGTMAVTKHRSAAAKHLKQAITEVGLGLAHVKKNKKNQANKVNAAKKANKQ